MVEKRRVSRMMTQVLKEAITSVGIRSKFRCVSIIECTEILLEEVNRIAREYARQLHDLDTTGEELIDSQEYD